MPISRGQMPRQMYGLGSLVKSIGKTVKKIVKSPVAKVAMLGFGANALMPGGLSSLFSGGGGLTGILGKGKSILDGLTGAQKITGALALGGAFAGMEDQQVEELRQNPEALRGYLAQYYRNLNQGASDEEVNRFVEANMTEYKANGGRIGYREGELAYDATNTNIYGSSAASFTPKTIMNQSGDQVQAGFGKTPGRPEMQPGNPFMGKPAIPDISNRPATLPNQPFGQPLFDKDGFRLGDQRYGTGLVGGPSMALPGSGLTNQTPLAGSGGISEIDMPIAGGNNNAGGILPVESQLPGFRDEKAEYYTGKNYGPGNQGYAAVMPQEGMTFVYDQNGRRYSVPIEGYEGPTSLSSALQQPMPFAQQANSSSPIAQVAQMANGGRMGYQDGTGDPTYTGNNMEDLPRGLQMDTTTSNPIPEESSFMENLTLLNEIKGGVSPSTKIYLLKEFMDKALERGEITEERYNEMLMPFFGETGEGITSQIENFERENFAMGSPEENAVQASGIMDLPLNQNPAGITELDLRETGGFIPPVGVKEKADDIPAMLSNNEFVFTADAVRGMGEGNVNKGAQRMYDMMKKLEKGGRV